MDRPSQDDADDDGIERLQPQQPRRKPRQGKPGDGARDGPPPQGPDDYGVPPGEAFALPPPPDLASLTADAWEAKTLPPRDWLAGTALCTTSRWMIVGDTGVGKTLFGLAFGMGIASNRQVLNWKPCGRPRAVMYIDGEMPAETFQERIKLAKALYGAAGVKFYGYNLEELEQKGEGFEPFNTEAGRAWLMREIGRLKPDLIIFDSIMCLTINAMNDDRAWLPVAELMSWITSKRIAQIWIHHTGHNPNRGFGTKSREWRLDTVIVLIKASEDGLGAEDGAPIEMRFMKARLRTPKNRDQFQEWKIAFGPQGWRSVGRPLTDKSPARAKTDKSIVTRAFCNTYDRLAEDVEQSGETSKGYKIFKVGVEKIRNELKSAGFLETDDKGHIEGKSREAFRQVKIGLLADGFQQKDGMIWRTKPPPSRAAAVAMAEQENEQA
jgi:hypothetical protein